jgi:hypothetical protein
MAIWNSYQGNQYHALGNYSFTNTGMPKLAIILTIIMNPILLFLLAMIEGRVCGAIAYQIRTKKYTFCLSNYDTNI